MFKYNAHVYNNKYLKYVIWYLKFVIVYVYSRY